MLMLIAKYRGYLCLLESRLRCWHQLFRLRRELFRGGVGESDGGSDQALWLEAQ